MNERLEIVARVTHAFLIIYLLGRILIVMSSAFSGMQSSVCRVKRENRKKGEHAIDRLTTMLMLGVRETSSPLSSSAAPSAISCCSSEPSVESGIQRNKANGN